MGLEHSKSMLSGSWCTRTTALWDHRPDAWPPSHTGWDLLEAEIQLQATGCRGCAEGMLRFNSRLAKTERTTWAKQGEGGMNPSGLWVGRGLSWWDSPKSVSRA